MSIIWTAVERNLTAIGGDPRVVRRPRTLDRTDAVNDELVVRSSSHCRTTAVFNVNYIIELAGAVLERAGFSCVMRNLG